MITDDDDDERRQRQTTLLQPGELLRFSPAWDSAACRSAHTVSVHFYYVCAPPPAVHNTRSHGFFTFFSPLPPRVADDSLGIAYALLSKQPPCLFKYIQIFILLFSRTHLLQIIISHTKI